MGDPNASIPTPQPVHQRPMFASFGLAMPARCVTFLSQAAIDADVPGMLGLKRIIAAVHGTRGIGKRDMKLNDALPVIEVDSETYEVRADGELMTCEPAKELPLAHRYFLF
jgi:urease subunit alpha